MNVARCWCGGNVCNDEVIGNRMLIVCCWVGLCCKCWVGGHTVSRLSVCRIRGRVIMMSRCIDMCAQEACKGGISYLRWASRVFWPEFVSWRSCVVEAVLSSSVSGMPAMAASLLSATMCFLKTRAYYFSRCFPKMMWPSFADVRSWKPVMPRLISGLVMKLMRLVIVWGGECRWEWLLNKFEIG